MKTVLRLRPVHTQLGLLVLYYILDSEESEYEKAEDGCIAAQVIVDGNRSEFALSVSEDPPVTVLTVQMRTPCAGLSEKGGRRAPYDLADRVERLLDTEMS